MEAKILYNSTKLLEQYKKEAREQLSISGYFPKFGYSNLKYSIDSIWGKWNIKYNKEFQKLSFDPIKENQSCALYGKKGAGHCLTYINGKTMELSEIGNYLIGYNGAYAGFTLNMFGMGNDIDSNKSGFSYSLPLAIGFIFSDIYDSGMRVEFGNYYSSKLSYDEILELALEDELQDRPGYDTGYLDARNEMRDKLKSLFN